MHITQRFPFAPLVAALALGACSHTDPPPPGAPFVGTWTHAGTLTTSCTARTATTSALTGTVSIVASDSVVDAYDSTFACDLHYEVSGNVASALAGQTCDYAGDGGLVYHAIVTSHTLALSSDGNSLTESGAANLVVGRSSSGTGVACQMSWSGTLTKP